MADQYEQNSRSPNTCRFNLSRFDHMSLVLVAVFMLGTIIIINQFSQ